MKTKRVILLAIIFALAVQIIPVPRYLPLMAAAASRTWDDGVGIKNIYFLDAFIGERPYVVKDDGTIWAWGYELSDTPQLFSINNVKIGVNELEYYLVLDESNVLWGLGNNFEGRMGQGTATNEFFNGAVAYEKPVKILDGVKNFTTGKGHVLALKNDGTLWAWGNSDCGQVGDGTTLVQNVYVDGPFLGSGSMVPAYIKTPIKIMDDIAKISATWNNSYAIKTDGTLWAWGETSGNGFEGNVYSPVKILDSVKDIASGMQSACAVKTDGSLWVWGKYYNVDESGPVKIKNLLTPQMIKDKGVKSAVFNQMLLQWVTEDGWLYVSGYAALGGNSGTFQYDEDTRVVGGVALLESSGNYTIIVMNDGSLQCMGGETVSMSHMTGIAGRSTAISYLTPQKLRGAAPASSILSLSGNLQPGNLQAQGNEPSQPGAAPQTTAPAPASAPAQAVANPPTGQPQAAVPTSSAVLVDGQNVNFHAYNINDYNYFKLRDLAYVLNGTDKQFEVGWDDGNNAISLSSSAPYTVAGGEMEGKGEGGKTAFATSSKIYLDGIEAQFTAYNIDGNNYFKLRDIGEAIGFIVDWDDAANTIIINTIG